MPIEHRARISGPDGAHPEFAAIRLIALLPAGWTANLLECSGRTAALTFTVPDDLTATTFETALDEVLSAPPLRGWTRD